MKNTSTNSLPISFVKSAGVWMLLLALALTACSQSDQTNQSNSGTVVVRLPDNALEKMNSSSIGTREISGKPQDIARIIITLTDTQGKILGSGDILQSGNELRFTVPAHVDMLLYGVAYNAANVERFKGQTDINNPIPALAPGGTARPTLVLEEILVEPPTPNVVGFVVTSLGSFSNGSVKVYEVDNNGAVVGDAIASSAVDSEGGYRLTVPDTVVFGSRYILRYEELDVVRLDARLIAENVEISPPSHVTSQLVTQLSTVKGLQEISVGEIVEIEQSVVELANQLGLANSSAVDMYIDGILTEVSNNLNYRNVISSKASSGLLCGVVQDDQSPTPQLLSGVRIEVRDFFSQLLRASTTTDAQGNYCVNVPRVGEIDALGQDTAKGDYTVGAMNLTTTHAVASGWWKQGLPNGAPLLADGDKITVPSSGEGGADRIADFTLTPGARIKGSVSLGEGGGLFGVKIIVRDAKTQLIAAQTPSDANFVINVAPGSYILEAQNTLANLPYASQVNGGSNNLNLAPVLTLAVGDTHQENFALETGVELTGTVSEGGVPVTGVQATVNLQANFGVGNGGPSTTLLVDRADGSFRIWLRPEIYDVYVYGQQFFSTNLIDTTTANIVASADVAKLPVTSLAPDGSPISKVKLHLYQDQTEGYALMHSDFSRSDGSAILYTDVSDSHFVAGTVDDAQAHSSIVYDNELTIIFSTSVYLTPGSTAPAISLITKEAGVLTGKVTTDSNGLVPAVNMTVSVYDSRGWDVIAPTRTRGDGSFTLSLPAGTYDTIEFYDNINPGIQCKFVPVQVGTTTVLSVTTAAASVSCQIKAQNDLVRIGSVVFDPTVSWDVTKHPLKLPITNTTNWPMMGYDVTSGSTGDYSFNMNDPAQSIPGVSVNDPAQTGNVPVTVTTHVTFSEVVETDVYALAIDGAIYKLASGATVYGEPRLVFPADITKPQRWNLYNVNGSFVGSGELREVGVVSRIGYSNTLHYIQTDNTTGESWHWHFRVGEGLLDEYETTINEYWYRSDIAPDVGG